MYQIENFSTMPKETDDSAEDVADSDVEASNLPVAGGVPIAAATPIGKKDAPATPR
jgi:hypothetical protein